MKIIIKSLVLRNFKGAKNVEINFNENITNITGDNSTGKTTIFDAYNWLLFGKNSENNSQFSIKTLDSENKPASKLEHEVSGIIDVDGIEYAFKRIYKEKWVKKRGSSIEEFNGHIEELYINDVPKSLTEYNLTTNQLFNTSLSRMISDPSYFNEQMKREERRVVLVKMAGEVSEQSVLDQHPELDLIPSIFEERKTIKNKQDELSAKKTKINQELKDIPNRLDEVDRSIDKDLKSVETLNAEKEEIEEKIKQNQKAIADTSIAAEKHNQGKTNLVKKKGELELELQNEKNKAIQDANKERNELINKKEVLEANLKSKEYKLAQNQLELKANISAIDKIRESNTRLKKSYEEVQAKNIDPDKLNCPSCSQALPKDEIDQKIKELSEYKSTESKRLIECANSNNERIPLFEELNRGHENEIVILNTEIGSIEKQLSEIVIPEENNTTIENAFNSGALYISIQRIQAEIDNYPVFSDHSTEIYSKEITQLGYQIDAIKLDLQKHELNERAKERIVELTSQQKTLIGELGKIEAFEMQIAEFIKLQIEAVERSVSSNFEGIKFKMFEQQVNGGETPTCICLVNGVPYPDVNTAGQVNAGLQIIKALQKYYNQFAPVFIDNRERVSKIIEMDCQIINLSCVTGQEKLLVS